MKIETKPQSECQIIVHVEVEPQHLEPAMKRAARAISERIKIPGFRPGKAPYNLVVQHVGEKTVREEALEMLADELYPEALHELNLNPSYPGLLTDVQEGKSLRFTFQVPLQPQVSLGDYRSVRVPYKWKPPSERQVDQFLRTLQVQAGKIRNVGDERPLQNGDLAAIHIAFRNTKASPEEQPSLQGNPVIWIEEDGRDPDELPFPGFSAQLIGLRKGESKVILYKYPREGSIDEVLRGQKIAHEVTIREIIEIPEPDDAFAREIGLFETLEALRERVAKTLSSISQADYDLSYAVKVIDAIRKKAKVSYPPQMLMEAIQEMVEAHKKALAEDGLDLDTYLQAHSLTLEEFIEKEIKPEAMANVERRLILFEIETRERPEVSIEKAKDLFQQKLVRLLQQQEQAGGKRKWKPSRYEGERMFYQSLVEVKKQALVQRIVAIGRGEAPELEEETDATPNAKAVSQEEDSSDKPGQGALTDPLNDRSNTE